MTFCNAIFLQQHFTDNSFSAIIILIIINLQIGRNNLIHLLINTSNINRQIKSFPLIIHRYNMKNSSGQDLLLDFGGEGGTLMINKQMVSRTTKADYFAGVNADLYSLAATFDGDTLKSTGKFSVAYKASGKPARMIATADTKWTRTREDYIVVEQSFEVLPE